MGKHLVEAGALSDASTPFATGAIELMQQNLELVQDADGELERFASYPLAETLAGEDAAKVKEDNLKELCEYVLEQYDAGELQKVRRLGGLFAFGKSFQPPFRAQGCASKRLPSEAQQSPATRVRAVCTALVAGRERTVVLGSDVRAAAQAIEEGTTKKWIKAVGKAKDCKGKRLFMPLRIALTGQMAGPDVAALLEVLHKEDGECTLDSLAKLPARMDTLRASLGDM